MANVLTTAFRISTRTGRSNGMVGTADQLLGKPVGRDRLLLCHSSRCSYFTNTDEMKKDDPYAQLGLHWGDATSTKDIKDAFRKKARELHPDVNTQDSPEQALRKFQKLQKAYQTLLGNADDAEDGIEEWRYSVWRDGDRIAQDRTDVAGMARKRPVQPASKADVWAAKQIGHPDGRGAMAGRRNGEYLGDGKTKFSSVGTGKNKWVTPKEFKPWNPEDSHKVRASNFAVNNQTTTPIREC